MFSSSNKKQKNRADSEEDDGETGQEEKVRVPIQARRRDSAPVFGPLSPSASSIVARASEYILERILLSRALPAHVTRQLNSGRPNEQVKAEVERAPEEHPRRMLGQLVLLSNLLKEQPQKTHLHHMLSSLATALVVLEFIEAQTTFEEEFAETDLANVCRALLRGSPIGDTAPRLLEGFFEAAACWPGFVLENSEVFLSALQIYSSLEFCEAYFDECFGFEPENTVPLFARPIKQPEELINPHAMLAHPETQYPLVWIAPFWALFFVRQEYMSVEEGRVYLARLCHRWNLDEMKKRKVFVEYDYEAARL